MVWPVTAQRNDGGALHVGGVSLAALAREFGTPLYVFDVLTIRDRCRSYVDAFQDAYPKTRIAYAGKAWLSRALLRLLKEQGLFLDVVSGGELAFATACDFPSEHIHFHGNNKTPDELRMALEASIGSIVVDNFDEIRLLHALTVERDRSADVLLRLNPGIDVHTHDYRKTGIPDSKFGLGIATGDAERAVAAILDAPGLRFRGYHAHVGSQIFEIEPFAETVEAMFSFAAAMRDRYGVVPDEMSPGGGLGIAHVADEPEPDIRSYAGQVATAVRDSIRRHDLPEPAITIEPGRSIIGPAGVALYTLGSRKDIPGVRTYVSVDGGMADNIRPALYDAVYTAELVHRPSAGDPSLTPVTIAGKYCESGDILIKRVDLPAFESGDILAIPAAGAYALAMASNYNLALRPAVVFVEDGQAWLVQRRETYNDLFHREVDERLPKMFASGVQT